MPNSNSRYLELNSLLWRLLLNIFFASSFAYFTCVKVKKSFSDFKVFLACISKDVNASWIQTVWDTMALIIINTFTVGKKHCLSVIQNSHIWSGAIIIKYLENKWWNQL